MKILITGFDPFGGETVNPSYLAVQQLPDKIAGAELIKTQIPTEFYESARQLQQKVKAHQPDIVLNIGQAGGRTALSFERVAINLDDARIPDNQGQQPLDQKIQATGPAAYFTQLPIKAMANAVRSQGIPAQISYSAGTFVCNHIMYQMHYLIETAYPNIKAGFIHVPFLSEQVVNQAHHPSMSLDTIVTGLTSAIKTLVEFDHTTKDIKTVEGTLH